MTAGADDKMAVFICKVARHPHRKVSVAWPFFGQVLWQSSWPAIVTKARSNRTDLSNGGRITASVTTLTQCLLLLCKQSTLSTLGYKKPVVIVYTHELVWISLCVCVQGENVFVHVCVCVCVCVWMALSVWKWLWFSYIYIYIYIYIYTPQLYRYKYIYIYKHIRASVI